MMTNKDILMNFKMTDKTINGAIETRTYKNNEFHDYMIVVEYDGFHPAEYKLMRKENKIYDQNSKKNLNNIAEVLLMDVKNPSPYWIEKNGKFFDICGKFQDTEENKKRGYAYVCEKINEDEFLTVFYHIDQDGIPTVKFTEEEREKLCSQIKEKFEKEKEEIDNRWKRWRKKNSKKIEKNT